MNETYQADQKLEGILKKFGFIETTTERNKIKGKKEFKLSKTSRKKIYFDYINIRIEKSGHVMDSAIRMNGRELKNVLLYFKLGTNDFKELSINSNFNFVEIERRLTNLRDELEDLKEFDVRKRRQNKILRILEVDESIII